MMHLRTDEAFEGDEKLTVAGLKLEVGDQAPELILRRLENPFDAAKVFQLSDLRGKVVLINFVNAVSTPVCRNETRALRERSLELKTDEAVFLTVSMEPAIWLSGYEHCLTSEVGEPTHHLLVSAEAGPLRLVDWGVEIQQWRKNPQRTVVVINKDQKVAFAVYVKDQGDEDEAAHATEDGITAVKAALAQN